MTFIMTGKLWKVMLMMIQELTYTTEIRQQAIGYVRGIEATVNLYAKETGRIEKRA